MTDQETFESNFMNQVDNLLAELRLSTMNAIVDLKKRQSRRPENLTFECVVSIEELRTLLQRPLLNEKETEFVEREYLSQIDKPTFSLSVNVAPSSAKTKRELTVCPAHWQSAPKAQVVCASPCRHCGVRESCLRNLL